MRLDVDFHETDTHLDVDFHETDTNLVVDFGQIQVVETGGALYDGPYAVTPTTSAQTLPTQGKRMAEDVVIEAIPERYGLVTYDQNKVITVS